VRVFAKGKGDGLADITGGSDDEDANHGIQIWVEICVVYWMRVRDRLLKLDGLSALPVDDHVLYIHFVGLSEIS
jgi:hypothetical protein